MAHFEIKDLTFSYASAKGRHSLENVSLTIEQGEFLVLCGKSGSGKSTLLRQLKTVLTPNGKRTGEILFRGVETGVGPRAVRENRFRHAKPGRPDRNG